MNISRKRYLVFRNNRTEIAYDNGISSCMPFCNINDIKNKKIKSFSSEAKAYRYAFDERNEIVECIEYYEIIG